MEKQFGIRNILAQHEVIPVVSITNIDEVEKVIEMLKLKSINCIELTLRSPSAYQAIETALKIRPSGFHIGVGTIVSSYQVKDCKSLGVDFMVSPGVSNGIAEAFEESSIPFLPGVMTPSDIISGIGRGWNTFKLFPFDLAGGVKAIKTYASVFPQVRFCPTGGVHETNYKDCLAHDNVISVGGSWLV
ncbi:MAG: bifunctional 4-hydroxy-2-oxoglutarate aldolase/2-dehydro-3-deoxy-phosphogluconate aldolase [Flavobacteriales bacterium]|jgi:2-dehydro-3-deoxyphosphogluconate aldolase / (4S)-4-hydroxy-2-oxoglutarate aldolase|nr:bifunctional 4-hydroxy-2-oxoglutarate aldolase/2-dehydro-3-deoxy-phosphogluconate aldolase [Flavobacteriales bacterium]MBT6746487.1 bifunctional 4-hydroxy-2-oxoglutarate aldolase/2-dehydro-3-deoxy-phosphogluconate aldolase [Flavobacteriales bacterium]